MRAEMNKNHLVACVALVVCLLSPCVALADDGGVTSAQIRQAVQDGIANIKQAQAGDGSWADMGQYKGGVTALALLSLLNAGVPADDPAITKGIASLCGTRNEHTYCAGLKCQVLAAWGAKADNKDLQAAAQFLCEAQLDNGMWTYTNPNAGPNGRKAPSAGRGDNSNTQFALLGLHEAAKAGLPIPQIVWERSKGHFTNTQLKDGGWSYMFSGGVGAGAKGPVANAQPPMFAMTAAGLASLYICGQRLNVSGNHVFTKDGVYPDCGKYTQNIVLAGGIDSLTKQMEGGGRNAAAWGNYGLYALERVGMIAGMSHFGKHDWYREGAQTILGGGGGVGRGNFTYDQCFQILFLAKGNRPVLFQKVQWDCPGKSNEWNRNIHDQENLCAFINQLAVKAKPADEAKGFGKAVTWQSTTLDVPLEQLRISPVLVITGHEFPKFTDKDNDKLLKYIDSGGVLLFDACCGSKNFDHGFRAWAAQVFPPEYKLNPLDLSEAVFSSMFQLTSTYDLEGIKVGCRTAVFYSPKALSCLWELQTVKESEYAFQLGTNVAAYATGKNMLADRLDKVELPAAVKAATSAPAEVPRGAVRVARLVHEGDYNADPNAIVNLSALLRDKAKIDVVSRARHIRATDPAIYDYPVLFMTGHYTFNLSDQEIEGLRKYLTRGGVLVADACCGQLPFDTSFRKMTEQLFPKDQLTPLPADHPIYTGKFGVALGELKYRQVLSAKLKSRGTTRPPIEAVTLDGKTAILYSKWDFSCGLEGDNPYSAMGYVDEDSKRLALNLFLYAISY